MSICKILVDGFRLFSGKGYEAVAALVILISVIDVDFLLTDHFLYAIDGFDLFDQSIVQRVVFLHPGQTFGIGIDRIF